MDLSTIDVTITDLDKEALGHLLPHTGHALVLDSVLITPDPVHPFAYGYLDLTAPDNQHVFDGHFRDRTIMPGHWLIEFAALTCAALARFVSKQQTSAEKGGSGVRFVGLDGCRFLEEVAPPNRLMCNAEIMSTKRGFVFFKANIVATHPSGAWKDVCKIEKLIGTVVYI